MVLQKYANGPFCKKVLDENRFIRMKCVLTLNMREFSFSICDYSVKYLKHLVMDAK